MQYEPNPKHKPMPSPGRRGSICPQGVNGAQLLAESVLDGKKRYATDGIDAFCAQQHDSERDLWHGYPVNWTDVPPMIRKRWSEEQPELARVMRRSRRKGFTA